MRKDASSAEIFFKLNKLFLPWIIIITQWVKVETVCVLWNHLHSTLSFRFQGYMAALLDLSHGDRSHLYHFSRRHVSDNIFLFDSQMIQIFRMIKDPQRQFCEWNVRVWHSGGFYFAFLMIHWFMSCVGSIKLLSKHIWVDLNSYIIAHGATV